MFVSIPGHYSWTFDDPLFRVLLLRGIAWTREGAGGPLQRSGVAGRGRGEVMVLLVQAD